MSANNKTSVFKYKSLLAERSDGFAAICSWRERNRSRIRYVWPVNELKNNSRGDKRVSCNFSTQSMYSYGKTPFHVRKSKSSALSLQNSERTIFNLSLSRYDANLSRLVFRNLKESMNLNFTIFLKILFIFVFAIDMFNE